MTSKMFSDALDALAKNPTEGQVEKSVVFPILKELGYEEKNIFSKVPVRVKSGSKNYQVLQCDILAKDKELPTIVIEAKSPKKGLTLPDDYNQGLSYCFSPDVKTKWLFLTSGYSNRLYESDTLLFEFDLKNIFSKIDYFKKLLLKEIEKKKQPTETDIENFFTFSHNRMYAEDAIKPAEALHILTKLILIKTNEERGKNLYNLRAILEYEEEYIKTTSEKRRKKIEDLIFEYISACLKNIDTDLLYPEEKTISRNISVTTLFEIIKKLYEYTMDFIPVEKKGSAFDSFLNKTLKGRELGQFFTHRNIVNFMVSMSKLRLSDKIIDPACGTGGFIERAFIVIKKQLKDFYPEDSEEFKQKLESLQNDQIFGIEKDGSVASLAKLSMSMNGDGHTTIYKGNGLTFTNEDIREDSFQVILTNPPFGSKSVVQVKDPKILSQFDLGHQYKFNKQKGVFEKTGSLQKGQDIGVLFLERCIKLLKSKGRLSIILHDGIFSNSSYKYIRQYIRENCRIYSIVKLTDEAFKPYSDAGGTETSILFCTKEPEQKSDKCFFAMANNVGYKYKRKTLIAHKNDFPVLFNAFKQQKKVENSVYFSLSKIPIYERLDSNYYCQKPALKNGAFEILNNVLQENNMKTGFPFKSKYFGEGNHPLVKIRHLNNSILNIDDLEVIPTNYFEKCSIVTLKTDDILLAMDGKKEFRASYIDEETKHVAVNQRIAIIRVNKQKISPAFIFFVLTSKIGQKQLFRNKTQTATVAHLSTDLIKETRIPVLDKKIIKKLDTDFKNHIESLRETQKNFKKLKDI